MRPINVPSVSINAQPRPDASSQSSMPTQLNSIAGRPSRSRKRPSTSPSTAMNRKLPEPSAPIHHSGAEQIQRVTIPEPRLNDAPAAGNGWLHDTTVAKPASWVRQGC
jgi:hypothetical protein